MSVIFVKHGETISVICQVGVGSSHYPDTYYENSSFLLRDVNSLYMGNDGFYRWQDDREPYETQPLTIHDILLYPAIIHKLYEWSYGLKNSDFEWSEPVRFSRHLMNTYEENPAYINLCLKNAKKE